MIYFMRHGESQANAEGIFAGPSYHAPLTDLGRSQAQHEGVRIKNQGITFDRIISSPIERAKETAELLAMAAECDPGCITYDERLAEYDMGELSGKPKAGDIMRHHLQIGIATESKEDGSPVTIADTEIDKLVVEAVKATYPNHAILSEEGDISPTPAEYTWVCDPLDGTQPYTFGVSVSMFSLALVKDGTPILGVMYDPYEKRMYHAIKSEGAYLNGEKITVNGQATLTDSHVALPGSAEELLDSGGLLQAAIKQRIKTFTFVCVTAEAALVATGQIVANVYGHNSPWDIAAIKIIVEEAGGKVTSLSGEEQHYDQPIKGAIVSNGLVHDELVELVKKYSS